MGNPTFARAGCGNEPRSYFCQHVPLAQLAFVIKGRKGLI